MHNTLVSQQSIKCYAIYLIVRYSSYKVNKLPPLAIFRMNTNAFSFYECIYSIGIPNLEMKCDFT